MMTSSCEGPGYHPQTPYSVPLLFADPDNEDSTRFGWRQKQSCSNGSSLLLPRVQAGPVTNGSMVCGVSLPITALFNEYSTTQETGKNVLRISFGFLC